MSGDRKPPVGALSRPITVDLVAGLLADQAPEFAAEPLAYVGSGWDNEIYRLGDRWAVRLPRRESAVALLEHERRWLGRFGDLLGSLAVPRPQVCGSPGRGYRWPWNVVEWIDGVTALDEPAGVAANAAAATQLGTALLGLGSAEAPSDLPANPYRGVPLTAREQAVRGRRAALAGEAKTWREVQELLDDALAAEAFAGPAVWVHGDLHCGNVVVDCDGELVGLIDFGDLCAGDPACDVAAAWWLFDDESRVAFMAARAPDADLVRRARGWVAVVGSAVVEMETKSPLLASAARIAIERAWRDLAVGLPVAGAGDTATERRHQHDARE